MKKQFCFTLILLAGFALPVWGQGTITVQNQSNMARNEAVVGVSWQALKARYPTLDSANFRLIDSRTKAELPYQLERLQWATQPDRCGGHHQTPGAGADVAG